MTYRSIFDFRSNSVNTIEYAASLANTVGMSVSNTHSWLDSLITELSHVPESQIPMTEGALYILMGTLVDSFNEIEGNYRFLRERWNEEDICWFHWNVPNRNVSVFLNRSQSDALSILIGDIVDGVVRDLSAYVASCAPTQEDIEYLASMGIAPANVIPEISETVSIKENTARFSGAIWYEAIQNKIITLAGVGGIGSYVGFLLARMHPRSMFIYDDDKVEAVNMSGQLYGKTDIGKYKVDALADMIGNYADFGSVFAVGQRYTENSEPSDIMICGFDNMEARKLFYHKWKAHVLQKPEGERAHCLFIDGRLAAEELQVLCITGDNLHDMTKYEQTYLFSDAEADETVCSYKQTTYMANMIASIMVNLFTNFVANEIYGFLGRDLPFMTSYSGLSMQFKTE